MTVASVFKDVIRRWSRGTKRPKPSLATPDTSLVLQRVNSGQNNIELDDHDSELDDLLEELPSSGSFLFSPLVEKQPQEKPEETNKFSQSDSIINAFFDLGHGSSMMDSKPFSPAIQLQRVTTSMSTRTDISSESTRTIISERGGYGIQLEHLCRMISTNPSLQDAKIIGSECYTKNIGPSFAGVVHRFLVLQLLREGRKPIWVRMDRTRQKMGTTVNFVRAAATTRANDTVQLAVSKQDLLDNSRLENRQAFSSPPTLGILKHLLEVICEQLKKYELWPQNCWFFVSLIQQHLLKIGNGVFEYGRLPVPNLAGAIRSTVSSVLLERLATQEKRLEMISTAAEARLIYDIPNIVQEEVETYIRRQLAKYHIPPPKNHSSLQSLIRNVGPNLDRAIVICNFLNVDPYLRTELGFDSQSPQTPQRHPWEVVSRCAQSLQKLYFGILDYYSALFHSLGLESMFEELVVEVAQLPNFKASERRHPLFESLIDDQDLIDTPEARYMLSVLEVLSLVISKDDEVHIGQQIHMSSLVHCLQGLLRTQVEESLLRPLRDLVSQYEVNGTGAR